MTTTDILIEVFAAHAVKEIEENNGKILRDRFGVGTVADLLSLDGYTENFERIKGCKIELEQVIARNPASTARQVIECLERLNLDKQKHDLKRIEFSRNLIEGSIYSKTWTDDDRKSFDEKYEIIMEWEYYFLSYTNRNALETNTTFRKLIKYALTPTADEWKKKNLVARVVARLFAQNNVTGFFDYNRIQSGDDIADEIREYCKRCWAFVQIVEHATFVTPPEGTKNWCFEEYDEFTKATERLNTIAQHAVAKRFHFVITTEGIQQLNPVIPDPCYQAWFARAEAIHASSLQNKKFAEVRDDIVKTISLRAKNLREAEVANLLQLV